MACSSRSSAPSCIRRLALRYRENARLSEDFLYLTDFFAAGEPGFLVGPAAVQLDPVVRQRFRASGHDRCRRLALRLPIRARCLCGRAAHLACRDMRWPTCCTPGCGPSNGWGGSARSADCASRALDYRGWCWKLRASVDLAGFAVAAAAGVANLTRLRAFSCSARNDGVTAPQRKPCVAGAWRRQKRRVHCRSKHRERGTSLAP